MECGRSTASSCNSADKQGGLHRQFHARNPARIQQSIFFPASGVSQSKEATAYGTGLICLAVRRPFLARAPSANFKNRANWYIRVKQSPSTYRVERSRRRANAADTFIIATSDCSRECTEPRARHSWH